MPRYFFHIADGHYIPDHVGMVLPDDEAARREAMTASTAIVADLGVRFWKSPEWIVTVVDDVGRQVVRLKLSGTILET